MAEFRLKYIIDADGKKIKSELNSVEDHIGRLAGATGLSASSLDALSLGGAAAGAVIASVGAAAVTGTIALFELSKAAAEFGSEIFDASEKTGLSAETLSAMKYSADQSGASMEMITGAIAKYSKQVGAAVDGSEKAEAALKDLGVNPQEALTDLDGSLAKVFDRIAKAKPGIEQMTLAQKAFGKSGADLLPFIKSFDGDLEDLVKTAKDLGVTIDDEAARAADEFGDQLDTLSAQLAGVGRTIGYEFMPMFLDMSRGMSNWLTENKDEIRTWFSIWHNVMTGVVVSMQDVDRQSKETTGGSLMDWGLWAHEMVKRIDPVAYLFDRLLRKMHDVGQAANGARAIAEGSVSPLLGGSADPGLSGTRRGGGRTTDPAREAERAEKERITAIRKNLSDELALRAATDRTKLAQIESFYATAVISEEQAFERTEQIIHDQQLFRLNAYRDTLKLIGENAEEQERMIREIAILEQQVFTESYRLIKNKADFEKKIADDRWAEEMRLGGLVIERFEREKKVADELERQAKALREQMQSMLMMPGYDASGNETMKAPEGGGGGFTQGLFGADGLNIIRDEAMQMEEIYRDMGSMVADVTGQMAAGVGALIEAWVLYGDLGPGAVRKMVAAVLAGVAAEAAVKAVFQLAEGFAMLFINPAASAAHFKAAALYGAVAVGAGVAGRAIAGDSFKDKGSKGGSGSGTGSRGEQTPISRFNESTWISGRNSEGTAFQQAADAIDRLEKKISSMRPGDVVTVGAKEAPGVIGNAYNNDVKRNAAIGVQTKRVLG